MWKIIPHGGTRLGKKMKSEAELTLLILECYSRYGTSLSVKELCMRLKVSREKIEYILSILEKRGYLAKDKTAGAFKLTKKIAMLI